MALPPPEPPVVFCLHPYAHEVEWVHGSLELKCGRVMGHDGYHAGQYLIKPDENGNWQRIQFWDDSGEYPNGSEGKDQ